MVINYIKILLFLITRNAIYRLIEKFNLTDQKNVLILWKMYSSLFYRRSLYLFSQSEWISTKIVIRINASQLEFKIWFVFVRIKVSGWIRSILNWFIWDEIQNVFRIALGIDIEMAWIESFYETLNKNLKD